VTKQPGLDGRHRDQNGEIHHKMGNTRISSLRETYGDDFAADRRSDMKLENLLKDTGAKSLTDFRKPTINDYVDLGLNLFQSER
jgi:hypothetical protein